MFQVSTLHIVYAIFFVELVIHNGSYPVMHTHILETPVVTSEPDAYVLIQNKEKQVIFIMSCRKLNGTLAACS